MNMVSPWLDAAWAERIGWTLVHSVWQVAIVAAAYAVVAFVLRRQSANVRYVLGCIALVAMIVWPAATFVRYQPNVENVVVSAVVPSETLEAAAFDDVDPNTAADPSAEGPATQAEIAGVSVQELVISATPLNLLEKWRPWVETALPWLAFGWLIGVALLALRPIWGLIVVRRLKTRGLKPLPVELRELAGRLMVRLNVHAAVQFAESALVEVPTVVGYLRPMVLLPASAATGLSVEQLEMVLAHELAHVRRHDYLVNLLQTAIEALLFYHPGMWWVSSQVRRERENCCDDVAMSVCGDGRQYAQALYALEWLRRPAQPALAASGGSLVDRVRRLMIGPAAATRLDRTQAWLAGLMVLSVVAAVLAMGQSYAEESAPVTDEAAVNKEVPRENAPSDEQNSQSATAPLSTLSGRILYDGPRPPQPLMDTTITPYTDEDGKVRYRQNRHLRLRGDESLIVGKDGGLANVVIWARDKNVPTAPFIGILPPTMIRAHAARFEPHVLAFRNDVSPLLWRNEMDEAVNFDWSRATRNPRNMLVEAGEQYEIGDARPEPVPAKLRSNLQPWMSAYILPLAHSCFAVTGDDGRFEIKNLPTGNWEFAIWHEKSGWLRTDRFESGRFRWTIRPGENSLGDLRVDPYQMGVIKKSVASEAPPPKPEFKRPEKLPPLPTLDSLADRTLIEREIEDAFNDLEQFNEGHVIVGRLLVEGDGDPTLVTAQMEVLGGGYFAGATRDLERPVGFVMQGYEPLLVSLSGKSGAVIDVGTHRLKRLPPEKLVPAVGRVELEDGDQFDNVELQFILESPSINTPSNGTSPRPRWPDPVTVELDSGGRFYQPGLSPAEYTLMASTPGYIRHTQRVNLSGSDVKNLGTVRLERPRKIELDYIVTRDLPFSLDDVQRITLDGGSRWQITPHEHRWDLEFKQQNGQLRFAWSYGPVYLVDLGAGELKDFLRVNVGAVQTAPNDVHVRNNHVYLLRRPDWEHGGRESDFVLFKLRTNAIEAAEPPKMGARPMPPSAPQANRSQFGPRTTVAPRRPVPTAELVVEKRAADKRITDKPATSDEKLPDLLPEEPVATVLGQTILWRDVAPAPEWYTQRAEAERKHGNTMGYGTPQDYVRGRLSRQIWDPLIAEYRKHHETVPTDEELQQFILRHREAQVLNRVRREEERQELLKKVEEYQFQLLSREISASERAKIRQQLVKLKADLQIQEEAETHLAKPQTPEEEKFFAEWYVGNWKLQQSLYQEYGGRVIWQQVGPEAVDALRDFLEDEERAGHFSIQNVQLREMFWAPYRRANPGVVLPNPDKVFENPWSSFE